MLTASPAWVYVLLLVPVVGCPWHFARRRLVDAVLGLFGVAVFLYRLAIVFLAPSVLYRYMFPAVVTSTVLMVLVATDAGSLAMATISQIRFLSTH